MINLRHAAPARPAGELFGASSPPVDGDILADAPASGGEPGRLARIDNVTAARSAVAAPEAYPTEFGRSWHERGPAGDRFAGRMSGHRGGVPHDRPARPEPPRSEDDGVMDGPGMKVSSAGEIARPFIMSAGRTLPLDERLRMETLLSATPAALNAPLAFEHAHIVELCRHPLSVAEIAAGLRLPVGVARELIADLVAEHLLVIHAQVILGARPPRALLERIRAGVRAL
ncbi:DUF742 domain-containing protein [Thermopolyspora sp. NPDC052614]|uniref:DUF742 domain-containing protein n=1 Tax=Thermopolyspora sp. NPDC052614 TaxID=3155682 RepID=UPI00344787B7